MIRCSWCGAQNYAIDTWCASCSRHLDWAPPHAVPEPPVVPKPEEAPPPPRRLPRRGGLIPRALAVAAVAIAIALAMPVASWLGVAGPASTPRLPNTALRPPAAAPSASSAPTQPAPTPDATPTPEPTAPLAENPPPASGQVPPPAVAVGNPAAAVARFYQAVSSHDFTTAAALWTARMRAQYPPSEYIDHRFAATRAINLRAGRTLGDGGGLATVYVDVVEVIGGQTRHWVGTWQLVATASGWLLNRPDLRAAA